MPDRHDRGAAGAGCFTQPGIPGATGIGLEMACPRRLPLAEVARQAKLAGKRLDKRRIGPRSFPPDPMIEMRHREPKAKLGAQRMQRSKQPHAVASTRDRHDPRSAQARIAPPLHPPAHLPSQAGGHVVPGISSCFMS